jgi:eukaryotic-like serine/threonine-protein kinase
VTLHTPDARGLLATRYEIVGPLGDEALGRVWLARDRKTAKLVQVKVLTPDLAADPERFARFGREMTASYSVTDPNTLEVLDYGEERGSTFLVLEYVCGTPLAAVVAHGPLLFDRAARIVGQIARALAAAHEQGVVHRSLSVDTVLLLDNAVDGDFVKVRDFGLSKLTVPDLDLHSETPEITANELRLGDARYMAPEYIVNGKIGPAGDMYSLGALLFHLVVGEPPYVGSRRDMLARHVSGAVPRIAERVPDVPPYLDRLAVALLDKAPERRPGVHDILNRLEQGLGGQITLPELAPLDDNGVPSVRRVHWTAPRPTPRQFGIPGLGGAGTLVLVALVALVLGIFFASR